MIWPAVFYDQWGSEVSLIGRSIKGDANRFLNFGSPDIAVGFEVGKIVKYAGLNSDQLDWVLGKNLAPTPHRAQTVRTANHGHHANLTTKSPDAYDRLVPRK